MAGFLPNLALARFDTSGSITSPVAIVFADVCCVVAEEESMGTAWNANVSRWIDPRSRLLQNYRLDVVRTATDSASCQAENCKHYVTCLVVFDKL